MKSTKLDVVSTRTVYDVTRKAGVAMVHLQRQLAEAGLYGTMQAVNKASQKLGWEAAERLEKLNAETGCRVKVFGRKCLRNAAHRGSHRVS